MIPSFKSHVNSERLSTIILRLAEKNDLPQLKTTNEKACVIAYLFKYLIETQNQIQIAFYDSLEAF